MASLLPPGEVALDPSRSPERVRRSVLAALRSGHVPASFLYESPAQAARWLAYHRAWSPSRRNQDVRALYGHAFAAAARALPRGAARLVGLGCGGGQKDADAAEVLFATGLVPLHYAPIDASATLVREAARAVAALVPDVRVHPLAADLSANPPLLPWLNARSGRIPSLLTCFGMLPNQEAAPFAAWVAELLAPGDRLLISANLSPNGYAADGARILAQYDNPAARDWYWGALTELGLSPDDVALSIAPEETEPDGSAWRIVVDAHSITAKRGIAPRIEGQSVGIPPGKPLRLFHSNRFTERAARRLLAGAGLSADAIWVDGDGEEGIFLCERIEKCP